MKFGCSIGIFLNSAHLICRSMDISKCFRGSLWLRDSESGLYLKFCLEEAFSLTLLNGGTGKGTWDGVLVISG